MTRDQFLNILAFLILIGDKSQLLGRAPKYIIEKWDRYLKVPPPEGPAWNWGLDGGNRAVLDTYVARWGHHFNELFPTNEGVSDDRED